MAVSHSWTGVQAQDANSSDTNDTRMILNVKDNTVTLLNTTSNETISIRDLTADTVNMTSNETKSNTNITENAENSTTDLNLTEKFKGLQGQ
ncbi:MAG TPA: hypothetical protein VJ799_12240 [Nitrososphaeraceae archaeon]|nr:hypothetical protein [Nitrososphaeraceae archaeon]